METIFKKGDLVEFSPENFLNILNTMYDFSIGTKYKIINVYNNSSMIKIKNDIGIVIPVSTSYVQLSRSYIRNKIIDEILN